jgi:hypothetical protein
VIPKTEAGLQVADLVAKAEYAAALRAAEELAAAYDQKLAQIAKAATGAIERGTKSGAVLWREGLEWIVKLAERTE